MNSAASAASGVAGQRAESEIAMFFGLSGASDAAAAITRWRSIVLVLVRI